MGEGFALGARGSGYESSRAQFLVDAQEFLYPVYGSVFFIGFRQGPCYFSPDKEYSLVDSVDRPAGRL